MSFIEPARKDGSANTPDNSFGNLYMVANARFGGDNESKIELHELVDAFHDSIRNALHDCKKPQNEDDLVSMITKSGERSVKNEKEVRLISICSIAGVGSLFMK
nr:hypothetical protein CFP56_10789 [Quercus suber]